MLTREQIRCLLAVDEGLRSIKEREYLITKYQNEVEMYKSTVEYFTSKYEYSVRRNEHR